MDSQQLKTQQLFLSLYLILDSNLSDLILNVYIYNKRSINSLNLNTLVVLEFTQYLNSRRAEVREFQTEQKSLFYSIFYKNGTFNKGFNS